ncbi:MAG: protein kinase [Elusimicrobia bacterium]|jgi:serine/threonine protein kinase|nr:protein kinase [Elusimicrobiota bacterium]
MSDELIKKTFANCLILEKIGQGGMGIVYKAHHLSLNKVVCVKILAKELEADPRNIDFFLREAEISKQLDHPNTVHVYDYGKEKDNYYIVMSYVEGKSLEDLVKEKKSLPVPEASNIMLGVFEGIAHAHSKNIIHRDIKPSNIIVNSSGVPRIIDFGLARRVVEEKQLTITGEMIGTAYFMSPEQGLGKKVDSRADLYSCGATYFYILTGRYPYDGKSAIEVINKHITEPIPNLYMIKPDLPIWLVKIIDKLMNKNPDERYQTAAEVIEDIKKYKAKNYENVIMSSESEYNLEELSKSEEKIVEVFKDKKRENVIEGIEVKVEQKDSQKLEINKGETQAKEEIVITKPKKLQSTALYRVVRISYHIFYSLIAILSFFIFMINNPAKDRYAFIKSLISNPYSLIFPLIGGFFIYLLFKSMKIRSIFTYLFVLALSLFSLTLIPPLLAERSIPSAIDRFLYLIKGIDVNYNNLFIISFFTALLAQKIPKTHLKLNKLISSVFLILSVLFINRSFMAMFDVDIYNKFFYFVISVIALYSIIFIFYFKKKFAFIIYIISSIVLIYGFRNDYIEKKFNDIYTAELIKYNKSKEETVLKIQENFYSKLDNTNNFTGNYDDIEKKLRAEIKEKLSTLKEPDKEMIKNDISIKYLKSVKQILYDNYSKSVVLALILFWLLLNYIFITDIFKKEKYEL